MMENKNYFKPRMTYVCNCSFLEEGFLAPFTKFVVSEPDGTPVDSGKVEYPKGDGKNDPFDPDNWGGD